MPERIPYDHGNLLFPKWFEDPVAHFREYSENGRLAKKIFVPDVGEVGVEVSTDANFLRGYSFANGDVSVLGERLFEQVGEDITQSRHSLAKLNQYIQAGNLQDHVEFNGKNNKVRFWDYFRLVLSPRHDERLIRPSGETLAKALENAVKVYEMKDRLLEAREALLSG